MASAYTFYRRFSLLTYSLMIGLLCFSCKRKPTIDEALSTRLKDIEVGMKTLKKQNEAMLDTLQLIRKDLVKTNPLSN